MDETRVLRTHRSVRRYAPKPIPDDVLLDILEAARWTGSAKNTQPWQVIVVREPGGLVALSRCGPYMEHLAGARAAVVLVMDDANRAFDCGRLAQQLQLAAWAHGVGSCIGTISPENEAAAKELLGIPPERWVRQTVALGYPADARAHRFSQDPEKGLRTGLPLGRKAMDEFASWERLGQARG
jgi:nitroreductase